MKKYGILFLFLSLTAGMWISCEQAEKEQVVLINTSAGDLKVKLYNNTPKHRDNFIKLVNDGFYKDLLFHRVIKQFTIQAGDPDSKGAPTERNLGQGGPGYTIDAEFAAGCIHKKGALAASRRGNATNPTKLSSGSQFYFVQGKTYSQNELNELSKQTGKQFTTQQIDTYTTLGGTPELDGDYTVFGEVIEGLEVIDKIANVETQAQRPVKDIKITATQLVDQQQ